MKIQNPISSRNGDAFTRIETQLLELSIVESHLHFLVAQHVVELRIVAGNNGVEGVAAGHEVALDRAAVDADRFDVAGLDLVQEFAEIERPVGLLVWPFLTTAQSRTATQIRTAQKMTGFNV